MRDLDIEITNKNLAPEDQAFLNMLAKHIINDIREEVDIDDDCECDCNCECDCDCDCECDCPFCDNTTDGIEFRLYETEDMYSFRFNVAGCKKEDIDLQITCEDITLAVPISDDCFAAPTDSELMINAVPELKSFYFEFDEPIDCNEIETSVKYGILSVDIKKDDDYKPHKIEIK